MKTGVMTFGLAAALLWGWQLPAAAQAQVPGVGGIYTCVDAKGRKITADRPIADCVDREQKQLNSNGTVKRQIGPTLTAQERAAQEEAQQKALEEQARKDEEKRRDRALLQRYPSRTVHDNERAEAIKQIGVVKTAAQTRIAELQKQRVAIDAELEFYKKDPSKAPSGVKRQIDENKQSLAVQERFIVDQDREIVRVNARFDEELVRLKQLWLLRTAVVPKTAPAKAVEVTKP